MAIDPGPLARVREEELVLLTPSPPFKGIVEVDLRALDDADSALRSSANTIASSGLGSDEGVLNGIIDTAVATFGEIDGLSPTADLTRASTGLSQFDTDLDERHDTLEP